LAKPDPSTVAANWKNPLHQFVIEAITFDFWNTIARAPAGPMTELFDVLDRIA